ncbi:hypothetical protein CH263_08345 [Rhodococcus sp. 06-1059B-a]|nr:hypothetical protein CH263_08345 [Rhodococcus sp. 06-1059B-a]
MTNSDDSHQIFIIDNQVDSAIAKDKRRGREYERFVDFNTRMHELHRPTSGIDSPCANCGNPWPCGVITSIINGTD